MVIADARGMLRYLASLSLIACTDPSFQDRIDELDAEVEIGCGWLFGRTDMIDEVKTAVQCMSDALATARVGMVIVEEDDFIVGDSWIVRYYTIDDGITSLRLYYPPEGPPSPSEWRCTGLEATEFNLSVRGTGCEQQD